MRRIVVAVVLALAVGGLVAAVPMVFGDSADQSLITPQQLQAALARYDVPTQITANKTVARLISGPNVIALVDDTRDLVGNGSLEAGLTGTVLDSTEAARRFEIGKAWGWLRLEKRNVVLEVTSSAPKLKADAAAAIRSLR